MSIALYAALALQGAAVAPALPTDTTAIEAPRPPVRTLPALTDVVLKVDSALVSKTAVIGEEFDLELASPISLGDGFSIPAGTRGRGWVIHASKARIGGKPGELLLGARYLDYRGVRIALRSMKLAQLQGKDNTTLSMAAAATIGLPGLLISGGQARVADGAIATAKTSAPVEIAETLLDYSAPVVAAPSGPPPGLTVPTKGE